MTTFQSSSLAETKKFAERFAKKILKTKKGRRGALVLALYGELGSGKTTFVQGFFRGVGIKRRAMSPTFIIFRRIPLRRENFTNLYHVDAYRIKKPREILELGFKEILSDPKNIVLIEWADKIKKILPKTVIPLRFSYGPGALERMILG